MLLTQWSFLFCPDGGDKKLSLESELKKQNKTALELQKTLNFAAVLCRKTKQQCRSVAVATTGSACEEFHVLNL